MVYLKKFLIFLFFLFTCIGSAQAAAFSDVTENSPYFTAIEELKAKGVIGGYADGTFKPDQSINRAEALKMLYVGYKKSTDNSPTPPLSDLVKGAWYMPYVSNAYAMGYVKGYADKTFRPNDPIKLVELMKILMTVGNIGIPSLSDSAYATYAINTKEWYAPYLLFAFQKNIVDGSYEADLPLTESATRGIVADMLYRVLYIADNHLNSFPAFEGGMISYYADGLAGKKTSSGEVYNADLFTGSHQTFPFGTWVSVVAEETMQSTLVRINDRGPFSKGGILDMSKSSFSSLFPTQKGSFKGRVYKVSGSLSKMEKKVYSRNVITGVTFDHDMPNMVLPGEILELSGTTDASVSRVYVTFKKGSTEIFKKTFNTGAVNFKIPLYFVSEGQYSVVISTNNNDTQTLSIRCISLSNKHLTSSTYSGEVSASYDSTKAILSVNWTKTLEPMLVKLTLEQDGKSQVFYTTNEAGVDIDKSYVTAVDVTKPIVVQVDVANRSTVFSHDAYTEYKDMGGIYVGSTGTGTIGSSLLSSPNLTGQTDVQKIVTLSNADRSQKSVKALTFSSDLSKLAQHKAEDMAARSYFDHADPDGKFVNDWKDQYGYIPQISENIAYSTENVVEDVYTGWHNSPGHYANIMDPSSELIGIGIAKGKDRWYFVQHFSARTLSTDINGLIVKLLSDLKNSGVATTRDLSLEGIAQEWANYQASIEAMTFLTKGGGQVSDKVKSLNVPGSYHFYVFEMGSISDLVTELLPDVQKLAGTLNIGVGMAQGKDGWVRVGVIVRGS